RDRNVTGVQTCALPISNTFSHPFFRIVIRRFINDCFLFSCISFYHFWCSFLDISFLWRNGRNLFIFFCNKRFVLFVYNLFFRFYRWFFFTAYNFIFNFICFFFLGLFHCGQVFFCKNILFFYVAFIHFYFIFIVFLFYFHKHEWVM